MGNQAAASLDVAIGSSRLSTNWKNKKLSWAELVERLRTTTRTPETVKEYKAAGKQDRDRIKDVGGFVGGFITGGRRLKNSIKHRQIVTLDADFATAETWPNFTKILPGVAAVCYSTHTHTEQQPKLRIIIPVDRPLDVAEYIATARQLAAMIGIEDFDPTTYEPERLMYWPSAPQDGIFFFEEQTGDFLSADAVLNRYTDWTDSSSWPVSEREGTIVRRELKKQENPTEKRGPIGTWCRMFSVSDVIDKFLTEEYEPGEGGRYSYKHGTTTNGLVIYDDDLFAFSHHSTDPSSGKLCNAFDLLRIHKFGHFDEGAEPKTPANKLPSFLKMEAFCKTIKGFKAALLKDRPSAQTEFAEYAETDEAGQPVSDEDWAERLVMDRHGVCDATLENLHLIIENDEGLKGRFIYDEFGERILVLMDLPWRKRNPNKRTGIDVFNPAGDFADLMRYIERQYGIYSLTKMEQTLQILMNSRNFHPVKDYLSGLAWDGVKRIDTLFIDYLGVADTEYARAVSRKTLLGAVARIFEPGCEFQWVLTLAGPQGIGKTMILKKLAGCWFSNSLVSIEGSRGYEACIGVWINEMAEFAAVKRSEVEPMKNFISSSADKYRKPYAKTTTENPRSCIFIGTTNERNFLKGMGGDRRFWPVVCMETEPLFSVHTDLTEKIISQVWAEAVAAFQSGEQLHLEDRIESLANRMQKEHVEIDERKSMVEEFLERKLPADWESRDLQSRRIWLSDSLVNESGTEVRQTFTIKEIFAECFGRDPLECDTRQSRPIAHIVAQLDGWEATGKAKRFPIYGLNKYYERSK